MDPAELARRLLAWEESMRARGSLDLLGPSTRRALAELLAGADVGQAGRLGVTNGAAMRIAPVGIATPAADLGLLVDRVVEASLVTHNTGVALAGAAAVAAAVSAGIDGATVAEATALAVAAARRAAGRGHWVAAADVGARIGWAAGLVAGLALDAAATAVYAAGGDQPGHPGVGTGRVRGARRLPGRPLAGLPDGRVRWAATATRSPRWPARSAARVTAPGRSRRSARATVAAVNDLRLDEVAAGLLGLRAACAAACPVAGPPL